MSATIAPAILVNDIAFVAEEKPATTPQELVGQLQTAAHRLGYNAGINGAEDLETAAAYLSDAVTSTGSKRQVLLDQAVEYLVNTADMVDEHRLMV
ncbi:hypothetical protein ABZ953_06765 [Streptomyces sp. NPDC046465]|uniref:hypothetical protein n=1 Tax=Streptomyces sp. NPDC046465 TaxID=3155810 RepID=UPI0033F00C87